MTTKTKSLSALLIILAQNHQSYADKNIVQCPVIECDSNISQFTCYSHSGGMPVEQIETFLCPYDQVCNMEDTKFAWVTSRLQVTDLAETKSNSQVYKRYADKSCEPIEEFQQEFENGRACDSSRMCRSAFCKPKDQVCIGVDELASCLEHYECEVKLGCQIRSKEGKPLWPYYRQCLPLKTEKD